MGTVQVAHAAVLDRLALAGGGSAWFDSVACRRSTTAPKRTAARALSSCSVGWLLPTVIASLIFKRSLMVPCSCLLRSVCRVWSPGR